MTRVTKRTTYEVLHEGHLLEIDDEPYGDSLLVHVNGNVAIVGYLLVDPDAEDPIASDEGTALHGLEWRGPRRSIETVGAAFQAYKTLDDATEAVTELLAQAKEAR